MQQMIEAVIWTLNCVEVHGENNLDALLASIQTLRKVLAEMNKEAEDGRTDTKNNK